MTVFKGQNAWEQVEFGKLGIISRGLTYRPNDVTDKNGVRVLRSSNIYEDSFVLNDNDVFVNSSVVNVPNLKNGDILVTSANGSSRLVGKHAIIKGLSNKTVHGGFMLAIRPATNSYFLNSLMSTPWYDNFIFTFVSGGNGSIGNLKKSDLERQDIFIPLKQEQNKIGDIFYNLERTITLHEEQHRQLERLKKALLQKMFADETGYPALRFEGFTEKWEQRKFSELYSKNVERNSTNEFNFDKTISIAKMRYNSEGNGASKKSLQNYKVIRIGDVAFEGHTNKEFQYGRFVVNSLGNGIMSPRFAVLRPIRPTVVNFWKYYLHNERSMNRILVRATKAGTMMNELVYSDLAKEKIKVPIEKEQLEIGNLFSILDRNITLHDKKIQYLKQLKRGLLQKMFV